MLDPEEMQKWGEKLGLSELTLKQIEQVRSLPPSRRVRSAAGNVSGRYPSQKMGVTIQFESHCNELAGIYEMEYDAEVLEYYDQPPPFKLLYSAKNGRTVGVMHTPDFFVMRSAQAGWEEWKTTQELRRLQEQMPNRYVQTDSGEWRCPPGEGYAQPLGLYYRVRQSAEIDWRLQRNLRFLEDYLRGEPHLVKAPIKEQMLCLVSNNPGITLAEMLAVGCVADDIYTLIATEQVYVNLKLAPLATAPEQVQIFRDQQTALAAPVLAATSSKPSANCGGFLKISVGESVVWNGQAWEIVNKGEQKTALLSEDKKLIQLPNSALVELVNSGEITGVSESLSCQTEINNLLKSASEQDCLEANRRYHLIAPYLQGESPPAQTIAPRTFYRWVSDWRKAQAVYGCGYVGLLPRRRQSGNRNQKLAAHTQKFMEEFILNDYLTLKQKGKLAAYAALQKACGENGMTPPSYKTFTLLIDQHPQDEQTLKRQGRRAAYQHEPFYWELELTTPRHGDRPFEICHIDHTQLDVELVSSRTKSNLGRPWATFLTDAYSRRLLSVYLTFDPPSYRSCMMIVRECVHRHGRLPQSVVVDGGKEFESVYFERLLASYECTKKTRPGAKPRFGSVCERLFGTANTMLIHNLQGNTQITRNVRHVTKAVNPRGHAIWTLGSLYQNLCDWAYEFYDNKEHPALGQSPRLAYTAALAQTGMRLSRLILYDETFRILTLPTTLKGTAKVVPNQGVKINQIYYWHNTFRQPEIEKTQVPVRYDPYDVGTAYAYVKGQWVDCISQHYSSFHGHSEREMMAVTEELRQQHKQHSQQFTVNAKRLAEFLNNAEAQEAVLSQRLRDLETKEVLAVIEGSQVHQNLREQPQSESPDTDASHPRIAPPAQAVSNEDAIKPYEEFW